VQAFLQAARALLADALPAPARGASPAVDLHGPMPAPMPRRAGYQRAQLLLSAAQRGQLHALLDAAVAALYELPEARRVRWSLDVDPIDLY
jgi:primosomal protein N' (replication factor Y) (superfamily II helicase)